MDRFAIKKKRMERRKLRIKARIRANTSRPRLCINRSNKSIYAQLIDDHKGVTIIGMSTLSKEFESLKNKANIAAAKQLGKLVAEKAIEKNIKKVVFDRNGYLYHGKIKAFAESARESGLEF